MKKEYKHKIENIRKKTKTNIIMIFLIIALCILLYFWFVPVECEKIASTTIMFDGKEVSPKQCWNIYGHRLIDIG